MAASACLCYARHWFPAEAISHAVSLYLRLQCHQDYISALVGSRVVQLLIWSPSHSANA